jgi:hypothetical protein
MKEFYIEKNFVTKDGNTREVGLTLPNEITNVQYHASSGKCLEEPSMTEVELSKYQNFIDAYDAIITEENREPTTEELAQQETYKQIRDAKDYLIETDHKVLPDYDKTEGIEEIKRLRQEARELIRSLEPGA